MAASGLLSLVRPGDRVTIATPHGSHVTGRAVLRGPYGWVINLGGPHGRPGVATESNIVRVVPGSFTGPKDFERQVGRR